MSSFRVTQTDQVVGRGAQTVYWQCLFDGGGRGGGKYGWVDTGEFIHFARDSELV